MKLIVAVNNKGYIGLNDSLPWRCSEDLKHFKEKTMGCKLLVGRKTFEAMPPLKGRELIVVGKGYHTMEEALAKNPDWVIGGASIYEQLAPYCNEFHISDINDDTIGDTMLPAINMSHIKLYKYYFEPDK